MYDPLHDNAHWDIPDIFLNPVTRAIPLPPDFLLEQWHRALGHRYGACDEDLTMRMNLIKEEMAELVEAWDTDQPLTNIAKEMADVVYVLYGLAYNIGVPLTNIVHAVHRNNMSKIAEGISKRKDGKILKPYNYVPLSDEAIHDEIVEGNENR